MILKDLMPVCDSFSTFMHNTANKINYMLSKEDVLKSEYSSDIQEATVIDIYSDCGVIVELEVDPDISDKLNKTYKQIYSK